LPYPPYPPPGKVGAAVDEVSTLVLEDFTLLELVWTGETTDEEVGALPYPPYPPPGKVGAAVDELSTLLDFTLVELELVATAELDVTAVVV